MRRHVTSSGPRRQARRLLALATVALVAFAAAGATEAVAAEAPRWAVSAVTMPTNLRPGSPRSEVDRLTVDATGGTYVLQFSETAYNDTSNTAPIPYNATAAEVQAAINAVHPLSATVSVVGGPGGPASYTITWEGYAADKKLDGKLLQLSIGVNDSGLTGNTHTATVATVTSGAEEAIVRVTATNVGGASTDGSTVTLSDVLPAGVTASSVEGADSYDFFDFGECETAPVAHCSFASAVDPGDVLMMLIRVRVAEGLPAAVANEATVSGGGLEPAASSTNFNVSDEEAPFGAVPDAVSAELASSQAGAHSDLTTAFALTTNEPGEPSESPRDVYFDLPPGLVGNTVGLPRCSMNQVITETCPTDAMVGVATAFISENTAWAAPIYNLVPSPGEPAAFGFYILVTPSRIDTTVLSDGNYGVRATVPDISEEAPVVGGSVTFFGVPADHNGPGNDGGLFYPSFGGPSGGVRVPLLTSPQQCSQPLSAEMEADPWGEAGNFVSAEASQMGTLTGCDKLRFSSSFSMVPDTLEAGAPAGYHFHLEVPQSETADGVATSTVNRVKLVLPEGTVVNPSAAWGLSACGAEAFYGSDHPSQAPAQIAHCPREAQVGTVQIKTPALKEGLEGQVYLAEPDCRPCTPRDAEDGTMVRLYVQAVSEGAGGIVVKLEGKGMINQQTGQITTVFEGNPPLPFSEFTLKLAGGPRAVLANPRSCGLVGSSLDMGPWDEALSDSLGSYFFEVNENCFGPEFHPSFKAGMPNIQAGELGEFTLAFGRPDNSEFVKDISIHTPPGLSGSLTGIPLCKEAEANAGTCSEASLLGTVEALTGPGADSFLVQGGKVFLTEGYSGSQFGLSIVVPAVAGPYTLSGTTGNGTVVVRAQIFVDPHTAQLTVTSAELPHMLDGIPLQLKAVNVRIDRPHFMFNPTSCEKMAITGHLDAVEGLAADVQSPFQVTNCGSLAFQPSFEVSTSSDTSRTQGASLHVKLAYPNAPLGTQANIHSVHVELPKALPSRLSTLNHACLDSVFERNPADCPSQSRVGFAKAETPVLPVPLEGPAYFVSHGNQKFPELIVVLQGYGVTVDLQGETFISKAGVTSSTFSAVPDVPVGSFELTLPEGPYSALSANTNLCTAAGLQMPTTLDAQNGAQIVQSTPIAVEGCPYSLLVVQHSVHKRTLRLKVSVPQAGRLTATGSGVSKAAKTATGRQTLTLTLDERHAGRLRTTILLRFTPSKGTQRKLLRKSLAVKFP